MGSSFMRRNGRAIAVAASLAGWFGGLAIAGQLPHGQPERALAGLAGDGRMSVTAVAIDAAPSSSSRWQRIDGRWRYVADGRETADSAAAIDGEEPASGEMRWRKIDGRWVFAAAGVDMAATGSLQPGGDAVRRWQKIGDEWVFAAVAADATPVNGLDADRIQPPVAAAAPSATDAAARRDIASGRWRKTGDGWVWQQQLAEDVQVAPLPAEPTAQRRARRPLPIGI